MAERKKISKNTERLLWAMSAGRCEKCGRLIYKHPLSGVIGNFAQIAHNIPVSDGARAEYKRKYKQIDPSLNIDDVGNLLLLCYDCHKEVDEIRPENYPPEILKMLKADFEEFIVKATNIKRIVPTLALLYSPNLHNRKWQVTGILKALFPEKYIESEIDLTLKDSEFYVGDPNFWEIEEKNLERRFNQQVITYIENYKKGTPNLSVFAVGPIPLLVKLGVLLSNKHSVDVYQLKKSPVSSWEWETTDGDTEYDVSYIQQSKNPDKIILILSLSGLIRREEVCKAVEWDNATVVEIKTNHTPSDDYLRNKRQLDKFVCCYQRLKEELRNSINSNVFVHIFAAVPVSVAVEIGRHRNPAFDLPFIIYNYKQGVYERAITIGGNND